MFKLSLIAFIISFALVGLSGNPFINWLSRRRVGQTVREEGPKSHYVKSGTPTFGGILFTVPVLLFALYWTFFGSGKSSPEQLILSPTTLALALYILANAIIGFADDYIKVRISKKGLSAMQKTIPMFLVIALFVVYYLFFFPGGPVLLLPFSKTVISISGWWKLPYGILAFLYLYYIGNSVNFTDGVDGLLSSVSMPVLLTLAVLSSRLMVPGTEMIYLLSGSFIGGLLAYLLFNRYPARIFMGDTGSLAIGAFVAGAALFMGVPWILLFAGVIYWVESLTVMIQVAYFKRTGGKRIFKMTPIHHHFELSGWSENKIVITFSLVTVIGCLITIATLWPYFK